MKSEDILQFVRAHRWVPGAKHVDFLAAGEYNENYLVYTELGKDRYVFRINHGSQLGISNQIEYEFNVLKAVETTGLTPKPVHVLGASDRNPGVMLMTYIEGDTFTYEQDHLAARTLALVHSVPITESVTERLITQANPVTAICDESIELIERYPNHPLARQREMLRTYHEYVANQADEILDMMQNETLCIVNTELNSGNFIYADETAFLVDWEKAVISYRYQDLGHFLVPTTTLWKADFRYDDTRRRRFLDHYRRYGQLDFPLGELMDKSNRMEQVILLRAMSWCYMAYYEYSNSRRALRNDDTYMRITQYMDELEWFLK